MFCVYIFFTLLQTLYNLIIKFDVDHKNSLNLHFLKDYILHLTPINDNDYDTIETLTKTLNNSMSLRNNSSQAAGRRSRRKRVTRKTRGTVRVRRNYT